MEIWLCRVRRKKEERGVEVEGGASRDTRRRSSERIKERYVLVCTPNHSTTKIKRTRGGGGGAPCMLLLAYMDKGGEERNEGWIFHSLFPFW